MRYLVAAGLLLSGSILAAGLVLSPIQKRSISSVSGRVVYPNGKIAPGAQVVAFRDDRLNGRIPMGNSNNEGRFVITGVEDGIEYSICASKEYDGYSNPFLLPFGLPTGGKCKKVKVGVGVVSEVEVFLAPKGGEIEGEVRDARSGDLFSMGKVVVFRPLKFLRGQWTVVNPREATYVPTAEAAIDNNGRFKIIGLPTGSYFLKAEVQGRNPWYFNNQVSDVAAQPIAIKSGITRTIVVNIP
jgi:hypothetical protein